MNSNRKLQWQDGKRMHSTSLRRANTIVLVTGILVLLVIIATAYVTRTGAQRITSGAQRDGALRDDTHENIGEFIAGEITSSLFVHPLVAGNVVNPTPPPVPLNNANTLKFPPASNALRYGPDVNYPANRPSFHVVPFTNWPDFMTGLGADADKLPMGPGHPGGGGFSELLASEFNPLGPPGWADTRWLRDLVPLKWATGTGTQPEDLDAFSHYRHLTYIGRPENAWRIVTDISDVGDATGNGLGTLVIDLNLPVEQWLAARPASLSTISGSSTANNAFKALYRRWFGMNGNGSTPNNTSGRLGNYLDAYVHTPGGTNNIPPNFIDLSDLDGNGIPHDFVVSNKPQDLPQSEFDGVSLRWQVGCVLGDSDGDGFTDSFWWLAPTSVENGIRQVVAISIVDNQGMLDVNTATEFVRNDPVTGESRKTRGTWPPDIALVGDRETGLASNNANVGYYDNPDHHWWPIGVNPEFQYKFDYNPVRWDQHLKEVGLVHLGSQNFLTQEQRQHYWLNGASSTGSESNSRYSRFTLGDELELRMYAGCNYPSIYSRFESSVQAADAPHDSGFLRANGIGIPFNGNQNVVENSEYADQLSNRRKRVDKRQFLTLYNSVRNDIMPPWLWSEPNPQPPPADDGPDLKLDLRRVDIDPRNNDDDGDGSDNEEDDTRIRLRDIIFRALTDPDSPQVPDRYSYYGTGDGSGFNGIQKTRALSAALAANMLQYRDDDNESPLSETIAVPTTTAIAPNRYMGMEPQPFIVEAFVGHIYKAIVVDAPADLDGDEYVNYNHFVLTGGDEERYSAVAVVQIANPFDEPLELGNFQLTLMGQTVQLTGTLPAATAENPATGIYYAIKDQLEGDAIPGQALGGAALRLKWLDFLDIQTGATNPSALADGTIVTNVALMQQGTSPPGGSPPLPGAPWTARERDPYDDPENADLAVVITRRDTPTSPPIIIDRIDPPGDPKFGEAVVAMGDNEPPIVALPPGQYDVPGVGNYGETEGAITLGPVEGGSGYSHWVQWVRATRAWGIDFDDDGEYDQNERNPRFVFSDYAVIEPSGAGLIPSQSFIDNGNKYKFRKDPDPDAANPVERPWFTRAYVKMDGTVAERQPTFFNLARDLSNMTDLPDKGWYTQTGGVDQTPVNNVRLPFPMQMLHKNDDFEHVGEIYNVFMYGHMLRTQTVNGNIIYESTERTFSEHLRNDTDMISLVGDDVRINRLRPRPEDISTIAPGPDVGFILGVGDVSNPNDPRHAMPAIPAAARLIDAFVCDGPGVNNPVPGETNFYLAKGYDRTGTPGLININTAPVEVLRCIPNFYRLVHATGGSGDTPATSGGANQYYNNAGQPLVTVPGNADALFPRVMIPEAIEAFREQFNGKLLTGNPDDDSWATGTPGGASYTGRHLMYSTQPAQMMRGDRGMASIGELLSVNANAGQLISRDTVPGGPTDEIYPQYWTMDMGVGYNINSGTADKPFWDGTGNGADQVSLRLSTDVQDAADPSSPTTNNRIADRVAGDLEELNMLFNGASNLITTRSDTFTVYFRVRSFRQNMTADPPVWDATNPDYIVDDSRYVMLVDRSQVNHPGDKPKILYFEKLPN